jgi:acyl-CoA reductase-like NAD-dependent aldehyde dehydrogenase
MVNPYNDALIETYQYASHEQIEVAISTLKLGLKAQKQLANFHRIEILFKLADLLKDHKEKLATLVTIETGKVIKESRGEIDRAMNAVKMTAYELATLKGEVLDSDQLPPIRQKMGIAVHRPLGIILCITPFNFPINLAIHKIAPAFAAGNTIFYKPAPVNKQSAMLLTQLCNEAGITDEMIQCIIPSNDIMGKVIAHNDVACINFTGGTKAANIIASYAGYKKMLFELGGNDPFIVMPDADLDKATTIAVAQRFGLAGQRCTSPKRFFLHTSIFDDFKHLMLQKTKELKVGNPLDEDTFIAPVVTKQAADEAMRRINDVKNKGANILCGGNREGNIIYPTILDNVNHSIELVYDETFAPVAPLMPFNNIETMISMVNSTVYGLQAGVFTKDLDLAKHLFEELDVGTLIVNDAPTFRAEHFPFGGMKQSGIGREGVGYAIKEMSVIKSLVL